MTAVALVTDVWGVEPRCKSLTRVVPFPLYKVLQLPPEEAQVQNGFNLVLLHVIDLDGARWWWQLAIDFVAFPWQQSINVEDVVQLQQQWEGKLVIKISNSLDNREVPQALGSELL
jgi:hypothetical protein